MSKAWIARIRVGDVLKSGSGVLRVVRAVSHSTVKWSGPEHVRTSVTFSIRSCSWTGRPYTVYGGNDLVQMGYRPTRAKVKLNKEIDRAIARVFNAYPDYSKTKHYEVDCCDVRGIA